MRICLISAKLAAVADLYSLLLKIRQLLSAQPIIRRPIRHSSPVAWIVSLLLSLLLLSACASAPEDYPTHAPTIKTAGQALEPASATVAPSAATGKPSIGDGSMVVPPPTYTAVTNEIDQPAPRQAQVPTGTPTKPLPSPAPDPYAGLSVADLISRAYGGGQLEIIDTMKITDRFTRYLFTYPSDGLTIYGFMNVPNQGSRFPVAIMLHGYVDPGQYQTLDYTTRYADHLAEAGYFVIHPNLRGFPPSDGGPDPFRVGLAVDVLNLIAIIREQSQDPTGHLRRADTDDINLWGHSMGGGVTLRVITVNNDPYLRSAVLYGAMSGDEAQNYEKIRQWSDGTVGDFELAAPPAKLRAISPINHLDRVKTPVSLHHGSVDDVVPPEWSEDLCLRLQLLRQPVECHSYNGMPHTFRGASDDLLMQRTTAFFDRH